MSMSNEMPLLPKERASFGTAPRPRRRPMASLPSSKSNDELVQEFLAKKKVTRCPTRYAEGARAASGEYEF